MPVLHNKHHRSAPSDAVYIGRGSPWGNQFVIGTDGDRDEVVEKHRVWLLADVNKIAEVRRELGGRDLVCFCAPARCHGEILMEIANSPACTRCGASAAGVAVDDLDGLCLDCQGCPHCGRMGTGCDDARGPRGCDPAVPVEHRVGDLLTQPDLDAIAHGVNCEGVMGAGIAKVIRRRWPGVFEPYRERCLDGRLRPGRGYAWATGQTLPDGPAWIYNLASQDRPGADARLDALEEALSGALGHATRHGVRRLGLPQIGAGIGGLAWDEVRAVIDRVAARFPAVQIVVVSLPA